MTPAITSATLPATHMPDAAVSPVASAWTWQPIPWGCPATATSSRSACRGLEPRPDDQRTSVDDVPRSQPHATQAVADDLDRGDLAVDHADAAGGQLLGLLVGRAGRSVQQQGHVGVPLPPQQRLRSGVWPVASTPSGASRSSQPKR